MHISNLILFAPSVNYISSRTHLFGAVIFLWYFTVIFHASFLVWLRRARLLVARLFDCLSVCQFAMHAHLQHWFCVFFVFMLDSLQVLCWIISSFFATFSIGPHGHSPAPSWVKVFFYFLFAFFYCFFNCSLALLICRCVPLLFFAISIWRLFGLLLDDALKQFRLQFANGKLTHSHERLYVRKLVCMQVVCIYVYIYICMYGSSYVISQYITDSVIWLLLMLLLNHSWSVVMSFSLLATS